MTPGLASITRELAAMSQKFTAVGDLGPTERSLRRETRPLNMASENYWRFEWQDKLSERFKQSEERVLGQTEND